MTCFWDGILSKLTIDMVNNCLGIEIKTKLHQKKLVKLLKKYSVKTIDVLWNDQELSEKELEENMLWINELDSTSIGNGYDCSCSDPVLFLVCQLFKVNITHQFNGATIKYTNKNSEGTTFNFASNHGHFWPV